MLDSVETTLGDMGEVLLVVVAGWYGIFAVAMIVLFTLFLFEKLRDR